MTTAVQDFLSKLQKVKKSRKGWSARCPAHDDHRNSMTVGEGRDGRVLVRCHAGCEVEAILNAVGTTKAGLFNRSRECRKSGRKIIATYNYKDEHGQLLFQTLRYSPKDFRQRRPGRDGAWIWNLEGVAPVLYLLPELLSADTAKPVFIVEGEKDVDRLHSLGLIATTNPFGAGEWRPQYCGSLRSRDVVILPDNDKAGHDHALGIARSLHSIASSIKIVELPGLKKKGDVSDWLNAGGTGETLQSLVDQAPAWNPPVEQSELDAAIGSGSAKKESQADRLIRMVMEAGVELFHDTTGEVWARVRVDDHWEIWSCKSKDFRRWLARLYWEAQHKAIGPQGLGPALTVIEAKARFEGKEYALHNRVAFHDGAIWYDLCNTKWRAIRITPEGWSIFPEAPILFRRRAHQRPQVDPVRGGDLRRLLPFLNISDRGQQILYQVCLVASLVPDIPHAIIEVHGPQGAAKTSLLRVARRLVDPSVTETLTIPNNRGEFVQQLSHHWMPLYDNISFLPDWASDALCRAVTGEGSSKRELYSDDDDIIYSYRRCIGLNGINVTAHKPDLLDRCILFGLEPLSKHHRKSERRLWDEFEEVRPTLFGAMLNALSRAMQLEPSIELPGLPRMADFARWGSAIGQALGYTQEEFLTAYEKNLGVRNEEVLSSHPVAAMIAAFMEDRESWEGTPSDLLKELDGLAQERRVDTRSRAWPKAAHILTRRLNEVLPNLAAAGIIVQTGDRDGKGRYISLKKLPENSVTSVMSAEGPVGYPPPSDATLQQGAAQVASHQQAPLPLAEAVTDASDATFPPSSEGQGDSEVF